MENDIVIKRKNISFDHETIVYIPVFQKDFDENGNLLDYSTFTYSMSDATQDQQLVASMNPDYILELKGHFTATTKDIIIKEDENERN
jgi:hypothetical protein